VAGGTVLTRVRGTLVNILLAISASKTKDAMTRVIGLTIMACAPVLAWIRIAVINICLAVASRVPLCTPTDIGPIGIFTGGPIITWVTGCAFVNVLITEPACVSDGTLAGELLIVVCRDAMSSVPTLIRLARIHLV